LFIGRLHSLSLRLKVYVIAFEIIVKFLEKMNIWILVISLLLFYLCEAPNAGERTTKNKQLFVFNHYEMRQERIIAEGATQVWRCVKKTCPGRANSPAGTTNLVEVTAHNHLPNQDANDVGQTEDYIWGINDLLRHGKELRQRRMRLRKHQILIPEISLEHHGQI
jgi:hypothetical protein